MKIYLAGMIIGTKLKECTDWRIKVRNHYNAMGWPICFLDPLNGKELNTITPDGLKSCVPPKALVSRDYMSVKEADVIVANLNSFGDSRPGIGTLSEIAWAWTMKKPVILITGDFKYAEHPFIKEFCSWIVPDVETLLKEKILNYYFKGLNTAVYTEEDVHNK
jgi:hypothetical protein